jgi:hypothetical protein
MKEFEKFGCLLEFFYFLNPFIEILSAMLVLMLIEADYSYYRLDLDLSQIGHIKTHRMRKMFPRIPVKNFHTRKFYTTFLYFVYSRF